MGGYVVLSGAGVYLFSRALWAVGMGSYVVGSVTRGY